MRYSKLNMSVTRGRYDLWLVALVMFEPQKSCWRILWMVSRNGRVVFVTSELRAMATWSSNTNLLRLMALGLRASRHSATMQPYWKWISSKSETKIWNYGSTMITWVKMFIFPGHWTFHRIIFFPLIRSIAENFNAIHSTNGENRIHLFCLRCSQLVWEMSNDWFDVWRVDAPCGCLCRSKSGVIDMTFSLFHLID